MTTPNASSTPLEMWQLATECRAKLRELRLADRDDLVQDLQQQMEQAGIWPWVRLQEKLQLEFAGYPGGHIQNLPPAELWANPDGTPQAWIPR